MSEMKPPSAKQLAIFGFGKSNYDALICDGAIRSGKTSFMALSFVTWAMLNFNDSNFAICGKTVGSAIKNIITPFMSTTYARQRFTIRFRRDESCMTVTTHKGRQNRFYIYGGKDESSYTLIQGITLAGVMLDEVALMTKSFVEQALARCSVNGSKYWFNCNPENPGHWFYKEWIQDCDNKNALHLHFTLDDNPSLSETIKNRYNSMFSGVFHDRYIKGLWTVAEGIVYRYFAENPSEWLVDESDFPNQFNKISMGIDFGGNLSRTTFVAIGFNNGYNYIYVLDEDSLPITDQIGSRDIEQKYIEFYRRVQKNYGEPAFVFGDNASTTMVNTLYRVSRENGFHAKVTGCVKDKIINRVQCVDSLLLAHRLKISRRCVNVIKMLSSVRWDDKNEEEIEDKNLDSVNDWQDAFHYSFSTWLDNINMARGNISGATVYSNRTATKLGR